MSPTIIESIIVVILACLFYINRKFGSIETKVDKLWEAKMPEQLKEISVKINTIWKVYVEDKLREITSEGYASGGSTYYLTKEGKELLPDNLKKELKDIAKSKRFRDVDSVENAMPLIIEEKFDSLINTSSAKNVSVGVVATVASLYALEVKGEIT